MPPGISINSATGAFSGTPTNETSSYSISVTVTDDSGSVTTNFSWQSQAGILFAYLPSRTSQVNEPINLPVSVQNAYGTTLTFSATNLPAGLSINPQTGLISGTIAEGAQNPGSYGTQIQATDGTHTGTQFFFWSVQTQYIVVSPGNQKMPVNLAVNLQMLAINAGGPVTWTASGLPLNLSINATTGLISGTMANYGIGSNFNVTVNARDTSNNVVRSASFAMAAVQGFSFSGTQNRSDAAGTEISQFINAFDNIYGANVKATSVTGLPAGLAFDQVTRTITGKIDGYADLNSPYLPTVTFTNFTYNYTWSTSFNWAVTPSIILESPGVQSSQLGDQVDVAIPVLRQFGPQISFSAVGLPRGLQIDSQSGHIIGTVGPQTASNWTGEVTVSATDGSKSGDIRFTWNVSQPLPNVVQLFDPLTGGDITLTSPAGTSLSAQISSPGDVTYPPGIEFTSSFLSMSVSGLQDGATADVSISYSSPPNATEYYVYGQTPDDGLGWYDFLYNLPTTSTGAEFVSGGQIILHLVDGGTGDADNDSNGSVAVDVSAPAVTRLTLQAPDTVRTPLGGTITLPLEYYYAHGSLTFMASGLPTGLSIDSSTGVISGTIATNQPRGYRTVTISATDGVSSSEIQFGWIIPSFEFADIDPITIPEGAPLHLPLLTFATDPYGISYNVNGLPAQFYVDGNGVLQGAFDFNSVITGYTVHIDANYGFENDSIEFAINTIPGFSISGVDDRRDWVGTEINSQIDVSSPYGHQLNVSVIGLPQGLTIDEELAIHGTIANTAAITTINHVMVSVENETLGYTHIVSFDWVVRRVPTAEELNAGTPAGTPQLAGILDPTEETTVYYFRGVTYAHGATEHTVVYFLKYTSFGSEVWQIDNGAVSRVSDVDPNNAVGQYIYDVVSVSGRGILFSDSNYKLWFADETGARVIASNAYYFYSQPILTGDSAYVIVANTSFVNSIIRLQFGENEALTASSVTGTTGASSVSAFADGIVFDVRDLNGTYLKWTDADSGTTRTIYTAAPDSTLTAIGMAPGRWRHAESLLHQPVRQCNRDSCAELG